MILLLFKFDSCFALPQLAIRFPSVETIVPFVTDFLSMYFQVSQAEAEPYLPQIENRNFPAAKVKENVVRVAAVRELPETSAWNAVPKEWTCPICNTTTQCESSKISHLKGKKHKAAYEALKANNLTSLLKIVPPPIPKKTRKVLNQFGNEHKGEPEIHLSRRQRRLMRKNEVSLEHAKVEKNLAEENKDKKNAKVKNSCLKCRVCNISCSNSKNMKSHLKGRMHLAQLQLSAGV